MTFEALSLVSVGAAVGVIGSFWGRVRLVFSKLVSVLIMTVEVDDALAGGLTRYGWQHMRRSPLGLRRFVTFFTYAKRLGGSDLIAAEVRASDPLVFWKGLRFLMIAGANQGSGGAGVASSASREGGGSSMARVSFWRWAWGVDELMELALNQRREGLRRLDTTTREAGLHRRFYVRRRSGMGSYSGNIRRSNAPEVAAQTPDYGRPRQDSVFTALTGECRLLEQMTADELVRFEADPREVFRIWPVPPQHQAAVDEAKHWLNSQAWYTERRLPWRNGWLLYGQPGTGKTTFLRTAAQCLDMPIYLFDVGSMTNREFEQAWEEACGQSPVMVVLEDIDTVFRGRENIKGEAGGGLDFSFMINCIDGVDAVDGVFLAVTTNNVSAIDEALGRPLKDGTTTRRGRLSRALEFGPMRPEERFIVANRILSGIVSEEEIVQAVQAGDGMVADRFSHYCADIALAARQRPSLAA